MEEAMHQTRTTPRTAFPLLVGTAALIQALALGSACRSETPNPAYPPQIGELARGIARAPAGGCARAPPGTRVRAVGVQDFTDLRGRPTELGRFVSDEVSAALTDLAGGIRVMDRLHLAQILEERHLADTGLVPPEELRKVGRLGGIDALVTGRLTPFADSVRVHVVVLDVVSGEQLDHEEADLPKTPSLQELEARALRVVATPVPEGVELDLDGPARQVVEVEDVRFALRGCARLDETLHCALTATNQGKERNLYLSGDSRVVTADGAAHEASRVGLSGFAATGPLSRVGAHLLEGIPIPVTLSFEGLAPHATSLRLLELDFYGFDVRFPEVEVSP
jgi:hypothetical protein